MFKELFELAILDWQTAIERSYNLHIDNKTKQRLVRKLKFYHYMQTIFIDYEEFTPELAQQYFSNNKSVFKLGNFIEKTAVIQRDKGFTNEINQLNQLNVPAGGGTIIEDVTDLEGGCFIPLAYSLSVHDLLQEMYEILNQLFPHCCMVDNNDILYNGLKVFGCTSWVDNINQLLKCTFHFSLREDVTSDVQIYCNKETQKQVGYLPIMNDRLARYIIHHFEHIDDTI